MTKTSDTKPAVNDNAGSGETGNPAPLITVGEADKSTGLDKLRSQLLAFAQNATGDAPEAEAEASEAVAELIANPAPAKEVEEDALSQPEPEDEEQEQSPEQAEAADEAEEDNNGVPPEIQERINKRIGKEVAKTKALKEKTEMLESKLSQFETELNQLRNREPEPAPVPHGTSPVPLAHINTVDQLEREAAKAEEAAEQAENLLTQLEDDPDSVERALRMAKIEVGEYSPAEMRQFLRSARKNAEKTFQKLVPQRRQYLETQAQVSEHVSQLVPELKDPNSRRRQLFNQVLQMHPSFKADPKWPAIAMVHALGLEAAEKLFKPTAPAPKPKAPAIKIPKPAASMATPKAPPVGAVDADVLARARTGDREARALIMQAELDRQNARFG